MVIFLCRDEFNSILCGVYDAWMSGLGHENLRLETEDSGSTMELFAEYRQVEETEEKAEKVGQAIRKRISWEAYTWVYRAALSCQEGKADSIYRFLIQGFRLGSQVTARLQLPGVHEVFSMNRQVGNEAHLLTGFLRFSQMEEGILTSVIGPKHDVISIVADHFVDRLSGERWLIFDEKRDKAAVHEPGKGYLILSGLQDGWREKLSGGTDEEEYRKLWKAFHDSIAVRERTNYVCQRTLLPLRYRPYMTEFQKE